MRCDAMRGRIQAKARLRQSGVMCRGPQGVEEGPLARGRAKSPSHASYEQLHLVVVGLTFLSRGAGENGEGNVSTIDLTA